MLISPHGLIGRFLHRRSAARWRQATREASETDLEGLEVQNQMASKMLRRVRDFKIEADSRLALPRVGSTTFARPSGTDWSWRPKPWRAQFADGGLAPARPKQEMTNELVIFHDCKRGEVSLRQYRNMRQIDLSPFGVALEVLHFEGSYMSLVIEVPTEASQGLKKKHLVRLSAVIEKERPTGIQARLNVRNGPNTEQILLTLPDDQAETMVEFDLAYTQLNDQRIERMWIDLLIDDPTMNKITFRDFNLSRYPRAEI